MRLLVAAVLVVALAGCAGSTDSRAVGSFLDPVCAPDGSVVYVQYANMKGSFDGAKASRENCPWNK